MKIFYKTQEKIRGKMALDKEVIHMKKEIRTVVYDDELRMEAYRFEGTRQPFPSHFHEHYVIGVVESGERVLSCRDREYAIEEGCIVLFNPGDSHACVQSDEGTFDYRAFTKEKGVTPYRYLETIRINEAKKLLSEGVPPVEAAIRTGFSDQSHFTNYFNQFIGLAPGTYCEIFPKKDGDGGQHGE